MGQKRVNKANGYLQAAGHALGDLNDMSGSDRARVMRGRWFNQGIKCPTCDQQSKVYYRPFSDVHAKALLAVAEYFKAFPHLKRVHVGKLLQNALPGFVTARSGAYGMLVHFGLLMRHERGFYSLTEKGRAFAAGEITMPEGVIIYDNQLYGEAGPPITIRDGFGKTFDYAETTNVLGMVVLNETPEAK